LYNTDSFGNAYFPAAIAAGNYPITLNTPTHVLVAGAGGLISKVATNLLISNTDVTSVFGRQGAITALPGDYDTDMVKEKTNLYFSNARARAALSLTTTGSTGPATYNALTGVINIPQYQNDFNGVSSFNTRTGAVTLTALDVTTALTYTPVAVETDPVWAAQKVLYYTKIESDATFALVGHTHTTTQVTEGTRLYYTDARARTAISLTTTGTSGAATYTNGVFNIPNYTTDLTGYATETYVTTQISNLVDAAPTTLNTLNELAAALGDDANFSTTITTLIGTKEPAIAGGTTAQYWRGDKTWQTLPSYSLPIASPTVLGGIKVGSNLSIDVNGVLSAGNSYVLPTATGTVLGGVKIGNGINISSGVISNYIYDTRNTRGATRLYRRDDDSDYSVQTYWTGTHWFIRGYNGDIFHAETRVGYSDSTGSVAWTNVSSRPTALSQFTNDLGNYGGWITSSGTAAAISQTVSADSAANLVYSQMADNDFFRIRVGGASNGGWAEIATADDGSEPIYVRQYTGVFTSVTRTATLLDGSGNTTFPGSVTASSFSGTSYWSNISGRPTALSQLTNDLGNYGGWYSASGGTISGNVTINGSSNVALTINEAEPYVHINATGASNTAGLRIYPTTGYDAYIGNFRGGALNLVANSATVAKVTTNAGVIFYVGSYGPITAIGTNTSAYNIYVNSASSNKTWDVSLYGNDWILNESNIAPRLKALAGGGVYADAFYEFSDKRFKTLVEENPIIDNIGTITAKSYVKEGKEELGYYAQDFEGVLDSALLKDKDGVLSLSYRQVHTAKIAALEKRIAELEAKLSN
jgi:hypothetical protein